MQNIPAFLVRRLDAPVHDTGYERPEVNTRMDQSFWLFVVMAGISLLAVEAQYQRAKRTGDALRFPPGIGSRLLFGAGLPFMLYATYELVLVAERTSEWWLPAIALGGAVGLAVAVPSEIQIRKTGVEEVRLWGLRRKRVPWDGAAANCMRVSRNVLVVGANGTEITHTRYHVGQDQFIFELKRHGVTVFE